MSWLGERFGRNRRSEVGKVAEVVFCEKMHWWIVVEGLNLSKNQKKQLMAGDKPSAVMAGEQLDAFRRLNRHLYGGLASTTVRGWYDLQKEKDAPKVYVYTDVVGTCTFSIGARDEMAEWVCRKPVPNFRKKGNEVVLWDDSQHHAFSFEQVLEHMIRFIKDGNENWYKIVTLDCRMPEDVVYWGQCLWDRKMQADKEERERRDREDFLHNMEYGCYE